MELDLNYNLIYSFKCGQMNVVNSKVIPDTRKGKVIIFVNSDQLLCWQWISDDKSYMTEPLVIFTDEWDWIKIKTGKGKVYQLKSKTFEDSFLFWLIEADNSLEAQINDDILTILRDGKLTSKDDSYKNNKNVNINDNNSNNQINQNGSNSDINNNSNAFIPNTNTNTNTNVNGNTNTNQSNKDWINNIGNLLNQTKSKITLIK
jgi:hypothetical protein